MNKLRSKARLLAALAIIAAPFVVASPPAQAHHNFWGRECVYSGQYYTGYPTRDDAVIYAVSSSTGGYHWGGGCWNSNGRDDQPGDPVQNTSTHGEGGDCSGFTFKAWRLEEPYGRAVGHLYWPILRNVHGPYTAADFKVGAGDAMYNVSKSTVLKMDAFASSTHIGMFWYRNSDGTDHILEAKSEASGSGAFNRTYRGDTSYNGVARWRWG